MIQNNWPTFFKACTLARRTAETFLKYSNRSLQYFTHPNESTFRGPETKVKSKWWRKYQKKSCLAFLHFSGRCIPSYLWGGCPTPVSVILKFLQLNNNYANNFCFVLTVGPVFINVRIQYSCPGAGIWKYNISSFSHLGEAADPGEQGAWVLDQ